MGETDKGDRSKVEGEGSYTAAKAFDRDQKAFVERNKDRLEELGKDAEKALDGPEGDELRAAEKTAREHTRAPGK